jgi:hypothetical protein
VLRISTFKKQFASTQILETTRSGFALASAFVGGTGVLPAGDGVVLFVGDPRGAALLVGTPVPLAALDISGRIRQSVRQNAMMQRQCILFISTSLLYLFFMEFQHYEITG